MQELKNKYQSSPPFIQVLLVFLIGLVGFVFLNIVFSLVGYWINPNLRTFSMTDLSVAHPIAYMLLYFLPFQLGFLLFPGAVYWFFLMERPPQFGTNKNFLVAIVLFASVFLLLPLLCDINVIIAKFLGFYETVFELKAKDDLVFQHLLGPESTTVAFITGLLIIGLVTGIAEEFLFRGFLFTHLLKHTKKPYIAILVSALAFALLHFNYIQLLPLFTFGVVLAYMFYLTGKLWPSMLMHITNNALNIYWLHFDQLPDCSGTVRIDITLIGIGLLLAALFARRKVLKNK